MQEYLEKQWAECMDDFSKEFSSVSYSLWLSPLQPINIEDDHLILTTHSEYAKSTLERPNYKDKIVAIIKKHYNLSGFVLILDSQKEEYIKEYNLAHPSKDESIDISLLDEKQVTKQNPFNPRYTFENFVVGTTNQVIYAACRAVAEQPGERFNPLFIYGGVGLGKTHLLHAIGNYIWDHKTKNLNIVYITIQDFSIDYVNAVKNKDGMAEFRDKYRKADILLIDDIQFIANREKTQEEFFHIFNELYQAGKQIIITSDCQPKDIPTLTERLRSRFLSGFIQDIQKPDFETRLLIIQKKIELEDYSYEQGLDYSLAERLADVNIREMEGILKKIHFYAAMHGMKAATKEVMEEVLSSQGEIAKKKTASITPDDIIDTVSNYFNIPKDDLVGRKRNKEIVEPRQICIYLMWSMLTIPLATIGQTFNRDHTTIIHARDKIMEQVKTSPPTKKIIDDIISKVNSK
ncbi:MAG: chromosomal replication initiator protein DnaA [Clostridia bacterium]|nr:chromosomal replication initiator protein DnaA [Clostridia bacterium]